MAEQQTAERVATTCLLWRLTRTDGFVVRVTEHDRALDIDGATWEPGAAIEASSFTSSTGLAPGHASVEGALSSDAITTEDLRAGLWNGARVDVLRADWRSGVILQHVWSGRLSEITLCVEAFEAELVSLKADLERPVGRAFGRRCDAVLGDTRCGVDLSDPANAGKTCDHRFATCRDVFGNTENFRGFPHMPGTDFILAGPAAKDTS